MKLTDYRRPVLTVLAVSALALTGCGEEDTTAEVVGPVATATATGTSTPDEGMSATSTATSAATDSATATESASPDADPVAGAAGAAIAIATAEGAVEDGRAVQLDREAEGESWIVGVASGQTRHEITVSADGEEVLEQGEEIALTDDKVAELDRATVTLTEAVETAFGEVDGTLARAGDLGEINGLLTWVVQINETGTGEVLDVGINAEDGTVTGVGS
ncbi:hypothetical protein [Kocuria rhizosphaericola]|uniref:hypothetical protein n=1 Tax=Kocuria rhizosphaericola TaxID=3376284 RepID=UPI0037B363AF